MGTTMTLRFLGKESTPTNSPTLYATDAESYVIQGWIVTDADVLARLTVSEHETLIEVPPGLLNYLAADGLEGQASNVVPPIVAVNDKGNYIMQGKRVTDAGVLGQMNIPDHETCIHVSRSAVAVLIGG
ncbi:hypothetical protein EV193_10536 [Herbihabitans rhizosphaerae]|uniref:Uncharacterized protein n=1 Tax=Herbihabitans rhizosphaerae TaxID=1872711 RepID=A0A4Q7KP78_9PSEU|nr:hypothetical protein [Herbihabitans rhizosphaerae]RZS37481.1 hypothetical protein EV193_10536 [Herbihabitans rhizosphaerae]